MNKKLTMILEENNVKYTYDGGWGVYHIHDDYETVCKNDVELEKYIEEELGIFIIDHECSGCGEHLEEYCYSPTAYCKDGSSYNIEDIITGMTRQDMINYENDIKKENEDVVRVEFGEFCPYCLQCI